VNGRLAEAEARQVESHLAQCAECRADAEVERRVLAAVRHRPRIEYVPQASFEKLWSRIEDVERDVPSRLASVAPAPAPAPAQTTVSAGAYHWRIAAGVMLGLGLGVLAARWRTAPLPDAMPQYYTAAQVPSSAGRPVQIRVVFAAAVTVDELTAILGGNGLAIVDGPSESGVYGLAPAAGSDVSATAALARLRADPRVRFAEPAAPAGVAAEP
jgi:hypothetical protein